MKKVIKVDFTERGKSLYYMNKQRKTHKKEKTKNIKNHMYMERKQYGV